MQVQILPPQIGHRKADSGAGNRHRESSFSCVGSQYPSAGPYVMTLPETHIVTVMGVDELSNAVFTGSSVKRMVIAVGIAGLAGGSVRQFRWALAADRPQTPREEEWNRNRQARWSENRLICAVLAEPIRTPTNQGLGYHIATS